MPTKVSIKFFEIIALFFSFSFFPMTPGIRQFTEIWDTPKARNNKFFFRNFEILEKIFLKINSKHKILSRKNKETFKIFFVNLLKEFGINCTLVPSIANFLCNELEYENIGFSYYYCCCCCCYCYYLENWLHCPCVNLGLEQVDYIAHVVTWVLNKLPTLATKSRIMLQKLLMNISKC